MIKLNRFYPAFLSLGLFGGFAYFFLFLPVVPETLNNDVVKFNAPLPIEDASQQLENQGFLSNTFSFKQWSSWVGLKNVRTGRFKIKPNWSAYQLAKHLKEGEQAPFKLTLNLEKTPAQVAGKVARIVEGDSLSFLETFTNPIVLDSLHLTKDKLMCVFMPNTYEVYWHTEPRKFLDRMVREYKKFWNADRLSKAQALNLSPEDCIVLASLVEKETRRTNERPIVARAYYNRLQKRMRLQCDPTVYYAIMDIEKASTTRQLTKSDLLLQHPYNTYTNEGLPPGPICMPSMNCIESVLNMDTNNYLFFCAEPNEDGKLLFAETFEQHIVNARRFREWLNTRQTNKL